MHTHLRGALRALCGWAVAACLAAAPACAEDGETEATEQTGSEAAPTAPSFTDVVANTLTAWKEPEGSNATDADIESKAMFVIGNVAWFTYHEFGHAMVAEFNITVLGREEDAVDSFATINMIADEDDPALDTMIEDVVEAWFASEPGDSEAYGEHSMDAQRGFAVICLLVGNDPEGYKDSAAAAKMPPERQEACKSEYETANANWDKELGANMLADGEAPTGEISIVWGDAGKYDAMGDLLAASGVLDAIAHQMETTFRLTGPITISVEQCGESNAFYTPDKREVKICYELVQDYYDRAQKLRAGAGETKEEPKEPEEEAKPE